MKVNCAKCGKYIANVVEPSAIKKGASLFGACYECKAKSLHEGGKGDFAQDFMKIFQGLFK